MTETVTFPRADRASAAADLTHFVCCRDGAGLVSFCGLDVSDVPWRETDPPCIVCAELERDPMFCPIFGTCTEHGYDRSD